MADPLVILRPKQFRDPALIVGFGTRHLGGNLHALAATLGIHKSRCVTLKQIHSNRVVDISPSPWPSPARGEGIEAGDALITPHTGVILCIKTADCVPVLVHDPKHKAIAAIHAGWRGLAAGIVENTLHSLGKNYGSHMSDLEIAIGPAICQSCFEIGPELAELFQKKLAGHAPLRRGKNDRFHLDLVESCKMVLRTEGLSDTQLETIGLCTACRTDLLYSYRKEGPKTGRLIAFIGIVTPPTSP